MRTPLIITSGLLAAALQSSVPSADGPDPDAVRPIEAAETVFMEDMTWMEIRDALAEGKTTAIVATGGIEPNGPYLVTGKHNYILRATTKAIADKLLNALVAPIVPFVPEGQIDPPTGHMRYPGTISVRQQTFERLLTDVCESLRVHGFKHIVLIGDSDGNQEGLKAVAGRLNQAWPAEGPRVHYIAEYYDPGAVQQWVAEQGVKEVSEGLHDDYATTAMLMSVDPATVRMTQRGAAGKFSINGVDLAPAPKTIELGRKLIGFRAAATARAIMQSVEAAESSAGQPPEQPGTP